MSDDAIGAFDRMAKQYQDKFMDLTLYDSSYDKFCEIAPANCEVLEIGCGPGNITKYIFEKRPDFKITATDASPNMIALAKANVQQAQFMQIDARQINTLSDKYGAIICGFCMPYLTKAESLKLIEDCAKKLEPEGILYFSFIEDEHSKSGFQSSSDGREAIMVNYHESQYLLDSATRNQLTLYDLIQIDYDKNGTSEIHTIIIVQKK